MYKIAMLSRKKICNFTTVREYQMPLRQFMQVGTGNKCVKFYVKTFQAVAQKMANNFREYFFAALCT